MAEENTANTSEATDSNESTEMVRITDATEDDLDAFLDENELTEDGNVSIEETQQTVDPAQVQAEQQAQDNKPTEEQIEAERKKLVDDIERYKRQVEGQELVMKRQISKIGDMKRQLIDMNQKLLANIGDKQLEDPRGAEIDRLQLNQNQQQIEKLDSQERLLTKRANFMRTVSHFIPPNEMPRIDELCQCLHDDGIDDETIRQFREDPSTVSESTFIQLQRRARAERAFRQMLPAFVKVVGENKELKAQLSNGRRNVLNNVERAARQTPSVVNARPSVSNEIPITDITRMSNEELEELLRRGQI